MAAMNRVFLVGNLTKAVECRQTTGGTAVADIGLAVSESYTNKDGQQVETTCFTEVVAWGRLAETCSQYLDKGSPILVEGRLEQNEWQTEQGEKRNRLRVRADRIQFLGAPRHGNRGNGAKEQPSRSQTASRPSNRVPEKVDF